MTQTTNTTHQTNPACPACGRPLPAVGRRLSFCPHCGRRIAARRTLPAVAVLTAVALAAGWVLVVHRGEPKLVAPPAVRTYSDPLDAVLAEAQDVRLTRANELDHRAADVRDARQALVDQVANLTNLSARLSTAVARATDENRWPVVVAGRPLQRADADAIAERITTVLNVERPAIQHDNDVAVRLAEAANTMRGAAYVVGQLRGELAGHPSADRRAEINRRAGDLRSDASRLPDGAGLVADPVRPVDADALLR